jgi:S-(hydroxymethyl)glutathione dehydrogenase/alcohol dehydrogenase
VVVSFLRSCGHCFYCVLGRPYNCEGKFPQDARPRLCNQEGVTLAHGLHTAEFAEYLVVDQSQAVRIPGDMLLDRACLPACGASTGVGAAANTVQVETGSNVVVIGAGGVGLTSVQGAMLSAAAKLKLVELITNRYPLERISEAIESMERGEALRNAIVF